jgi:hypothetical protein
MSGARYYMYYYNWAGRGGGIIIFPFHDRSLFKSSQGRERIGFRNENTSNYWGVDCRFKKQRNESEQLDCNCCVVGLNCGKILIILGGQHTVQKFEVNLEMPHEKHTVQREYSNRLRICSRMERDRGRI